VVTGRRASLDTDSADAFEAALRRDDIAMNARLGHEREIARLHETDRKLAAMEADARIVCVAVLKTNRIALDMMLDDAGRSLHVQKLVDLRQWSAPLASLGPERISHHVLEDPDPADAIVAFAAANRIDHILVGARSNSPLRRHLGSVSAQVVAEAPCSVTVIRRPSARLARSRAREKSALPPDAVLR
jgi:nucleotide-binding universal stress UspA family protein